MISIVMATHNGAETLPLTLDAFCSLESPESGYEIIVVDNASTDTTSEVAQSYRDRLPLTVLKEPKPGRTYAMDRGAAAAKYGLVLFTDDDVIPRKDWLLSYVNAAKAMPDIDIFAGQVRHYWQAPPPTWLVKLAEQGEAYAGTEINRKPGPIRPGFIKGPNFLVRSHVFGKVCFASDIGPDGTRNYAAGSETKFLLNAVDHGYRTHYVPEACIQHIVRPWQISLKAVLARYFRIGRGIQKTGRQAIDTKAPSFFGYPRFMLRQMAVELLTGAKLLFSSDYSNFVLHLMMISSDFGRAYQWKIERKHGREL